MKNTKIRNLIRAVSFVLVFCVLFAGLSAFFCNSDRKDTMHIRGFYKEPKNSLDVVLIGASEVYTGFNSPFAWHEYGFTSYAISFASMPGSLYKSALTEALSRQSPKLVVFEVNGFLYNEKYQNNEARMHTWIDNIPWSANKINTIKAIETDKSKFSYYFSMDKYHNNWRHPKIALDSFRGKILLDYYGLSYTKCFSTVATRSGSKKKMSAKPVFNDKSVTYFEELLKYCNDSGLKNVIFVGFPHKNTYDYSKIYGKMKIMVEKYGYKFANFENSFDATKIDKKNDYYNSDHLNTFGMKKFTSYFSKYICDNYDVKGEHTQEQIDEWNLCYEKTKAVVTECDAEILKGSKKVFYELSAY